HALDACVQVVLDVIDHDVHVRARKAADELGQGERHQHSPQGCGGLGVAAIGAGHVHAVEPPARLARAIRRQVHGMATLEPWRKTGHGTSPGASDGRQSRLRSRGGQAREPRLTCLNRPAGGPLHQVTWLFVTMNSWWLSREPFGRSALMQPKEPTPRRAGPGLENDPTVTVLPPLRFYPPHPNSLHQKTIGRRPGNRREATTAAPKGRSGS